MTGRRERSRRAREGGGAPCRRTPKVRAETMTEYTPGPWTVDPRRRTGAASYDIHILATAACSAIAVAFDLYARDGGALTRDANARLIASAPDLFEAALRLEMAELAHANCEECGDEPELAPECCAVCFPLFDDARGMRRNAIAKARGAPAPKTAELTP